VLKDLLGHLQDPACGRGDLQAQVAANLLGEKRLRELAVLTGMERWRMVCDQLQSYGRSLAMASLEAIPHGRYTYRDYLDDDGLGETDIPICVTVDVGTGGITVDFEGTSPQVKGNLNCPLSVTAAAVFYVFRCLMPDHVPACHGAMEPVRILAPEPCLVNAAAPAAVAAGNVETSMRITDAVAGALAAAMPRQIPAASQGSMNNLAMGARGHHRWDYYETLGGGMGAGPDCAGRSATHSHMTNTLNTPVEVLERHYPLRILRYEVRRQSGGIGRFSGGDGVVREYEFLGDAELSILSERRRLAPWGLQGGAPGRRGSNRLDGVEIGGKCQLSVYGGQRLLIETPGGGGFGTPPG
jgi:N-methylhydantoinase B